MNEFQKFRRMVNWPCLGSKISLILLKKGREEIPDYIPDDDCARAVFLSQLSSETWRLRATEEQKAETRGT